MKNKRIIPIICIIVGIILVLICIVGKNINIFDTYKSLFGILLGIGSGLFGGGLGQLVNVLIVNKYPEAKKKKEIEENDERNVYINNMAKAKAFNLMGIVLPIVILIGILIDIKFIMTIILLLAYSLIYGIQIYFLNKYIKEK